MVGADMRHGGGFDLLKAAVLLSAQCYAVHPHVMCVVMQWAVSPSTDPCAWWPATVAGTPLYVAPEVGVVPQ
jgi:hypothetical protein